MKDLSMESIEVFKFNSRSVRSICVGVKSSMSLRFICITCENDWDLCVWNECSACDIFVSCVRLLARMSASLSSEVYIAWNGPCMYDPMAKDMIAEAIKEYFEQHTQSSKLRFHTGIIQTRTKKT